MSVKVVAVAFVMCALVALLMTTTNIAALRGRVESFSPPQAMAKTDGMTTLTYSAPLPGGGTLTLVVYKQSNESADQFASRAAAEWAAVKAANGI